MTYPLLERIDSAIEWLERRATLPVALVSMAAFVVATVLISTVGARPEVEALTDAPVPETQPLVTPSEATTFLGELGAAGRTVYVEALLVDYLFVLVFAFGLGFALAYVLPRLTTNVWVRRFALAPFVAGVLDYVENTVLLYAIQVYPDTPTAALWIASVATTVKLLLLVASIGVVVIATLIVGGRAIAQRIQ